MVSTNVQGTHVWLCDPAPAITPWADCTAAVGAITSGFEALCTQAIGDLTRERAVNEYSCIDSNESQKSTGSISYGDVTIELLFDNEDLAGQAYLLNAFDTNIPFVIGLEHSDVDDTAGTGNGTGTIIWSEAKASSDAISYEKDGLISYSVTVTFYGGYSRCPMVAST